MLSVLPRQGIRPLWKFSFCKRLGVLWKCEMPGLAVQVASAGSQNLLDAERPGTATTHLSSITDIPTRGVQPTSTETTPGAALPQAACFHLVGLCRHSCPKWNHNPWCKFLPPAGNPTSCSQGECWNWEIGKLVLFLGSTEGRTLISEPPCLLWAWAGPLAFNKHPLATASLSARRRSSSVSPAPKHPHHHAQCEWCFLGYLKTEAR